MKDYCVIDVRDDDWAGGNIKGAHNAPSSQFYVHVNDLVQKTKDVPTVVFHCALSQVRCVPQLHVLSLRLTPSYALQWSQGCTSAYTSRLRLSLHSD